MRLFWNDSLSKQSKNRQTNCPILTNFCCFCSAQVGKIGQNLSASFNSHSVCVCVRVCAPLTAAHSLLHWRHTTASHCGPFLLSVSQQLQHSGNKVWGLFVAGSKPVFIMGESWISAETCKFNIQTRENEGRMCCSNGLDTEAALCRGLQCQQSSTPASQNNGNEGLTAGSKCSWTQCPSMVGPHKPAHQQVNCFSSTSFWKLKDTQITLQLCERMNNADLRECKKSIYRSKGSTINCLWKERTQSQMFLSIFCQRTCERLFEKEKLKSDLQVIQWSNEAESFGATSGGTQYTFSPEPGALHQWWRQWRFMKNKGCSQFD